MQSEAFDFDNGRGQTLSGRLERPDGKAHAFALFAHCFSCSKSSLAATRISRALAAKGVGTLRFDFTGLGESEGEFGAGFSADIADLVAAARAMEKHGCAPQLLIGHSLGGAAVLAAAHDIPSARAVAVIAAPFDPGHAIKQLEPLAELSGEDRAEVMLGGRAFKVGRSLLDGLRHQDQGARIAELHRPLLVLHSPTDEEVGIENASEIFLAARHPKSFVSLDHADHLITRPEDAEYAATVITAWASRYVGLKADTPAVRADGALMVEETGAGKFQVQVTAAGGERFLADEPAEVGGGGTGPTPYELIAAGLGACTAMTLRLYATQKAWPLERVRLAVRHSKRDDATPKDLFQREIELIGPLDDAQRKRMLEIADKCPVHRTLEGGSAIETKLAEAAKPIAAHCDSGAHFEQMEAACRETG